MMTSADTDTSTISPTNAIRRFDVFAEYTRQERLEKGDAEDAAKGYGIWLAKVVASRRFGASTDRGDHPPSKGRTDSPDKEPKFRSLGDDLQTDATFDHEIIDRMGARFYDGVFVPAITEARAGGKSYQAIRDQIRKEWKPARAKSR